MTAKQIATLCAKLRKFRNEGPDPDAGIHECINCGDHYHLQDGMDPSPLCHPCAQELVDLFAEHILFLRASFADVINTARRGAPSWSYLRRAAKLAHLDGVPHGK